MKILSREDLRNQLRKKQIAPVYTLFGAETYLRDLAAKTIADFTLGDDSLRDFNETVISLDETDVNYALAAAEQLPMMASRRVVRITNVKVGANANKDNLKEEHEEILRRYLSNPSESSVVIFIGDEIDKRRKMSKLLIENSVAVEFLQMSDYELVKWTRDKFSESSATIDENALRLLVGLVGDNLQKLSVEIEKLAVAALPEKLVTAELIAELVSNSKEMDNFILSDNLLDKNKARGLRDLKKILDDGAEPLMILGLIAHHYRRAFAAKELMRQGADTTEVTRLLRLPSFKHQQILADARRSDPEKLSKILRRIAETDLNIKTSKATPRMQIEMLFCELLES